MMETRTITEIFDEHGEWFKKGAEDFALLRDLGSELEVCAMLPADWGLEGRSYGLFRVIGEDLWLAVEFGGGAGGRSSWLNAMPGQGRSLHWDDIFYAISDDWGHRHRTDIHR